MHIVRCNYRPLQINRQEIKSARLLANPGCYPTCAQIPLVPLLRAGMILSKDIIIDAKSGVTGAGRALKESSKNLSKSASSD
jgi:N-acetyl-gamma-glutamyl-phosphate reductase